MRGSTLSRAAAGAAAAVVVVCAVAPDADAAAALELTPIITPGTLIAGAPAGDEELTDVSQVVLDGAGNVVVRGGLGAFGASAIVAVPDGGSAAAIAVQGDALYAGAASAADFDVFANVSLRAGEVVFSGTTTHPAPGLFRYDLDASVGSVVLHYGDEVAGTAATLDTGFLRPAPYGINGAGLVAVGGRFVPGAGDEFIAAGTGGAASLALIDTSGLSDFTYPALPFDAKIVVTTGGTTVFVADDGAGRAIYADDDDASGHAMRVGSSVSIGPDVYEPNRLAGATGSAHSGVTLFRAFKNRPDDTDEMFAGHALVLQSGGSLLELGAYDASLVSGPTDVSALMTPGGRIAAIIPTTDGGRLVYHDATLGGTPISVAQFDSDVGEGYSVLQIAPNGSAPMVNERGTVVFEALIGDGVDSHLALLAWRVGAADAPFIILKSGDVLEVDGTPREVFAVAPSSPGLDVAFDADVLKDGLGEDDALAFGVYFLNDDLTFDAAVVLTQIPEPSVAALLISCAGLLLRRRA